MSFTYRTYNKNNNGALSSCVFKTASLLTRLDSNKNNKRRAWVLLPYSAKPLFTLTYRLIFLESFESTKPSGKLAVLITEQ